jgi:hypothetical protein
VWGAGVDPDAATARTPNAGQAVVGQLTDTASPATYWAQKTTSAVAAPGAVSFGDSAPTADHRSFVVFSST